MSIFGGVSSMFGGKGTKAAHTAMRNSYFNPYNLTGSFGSISSTAGYVPTKKEWKRGMRPTPGTFNASLSPEMEALRSGFLNAGTNQLGMLGQSTGGFLGITPEMFAEFERSNMNDISPEFMDAARRYLEEEQAMGPYDFDSIYNDQLSLMRDLDLNPEQRQAQSALDTLYGGGILASTPGGYQTESLGRTLAAQDVMRQLGASNVALQRGDQYLGARGMLQGAALGFGQAGNSMISQRFQRAMDLFGAGQQAESLGAQRAQGYLGGVGSIDQFLANLFQTSGNLGSQRSQANINAYMPYIQAAMAQDQRGFDFLGQVMGSMSSGPSSAGWNWNPTRGT